MELEMAGRGRPRIHGRAALAVTVRTRALRTERDAWKRAAREVDKDLSAWIRDTLNAASTKK